MTGFLGEHGVEGGECFVEVAQDVLESGLGAQDVIDDVLLLLGLVAEVDAPLVCRQAFLEAVPMEQFGSLRLLQNIPPTAFESTRSSSNLNEI